jgi:hypothetical protein
MKIKTITGWLIVLCLSLFAQGTTTGEMLKLPLGGGLYGNDFISLNGYGSPQENFFHPANIVNARKVLISTFYSNIAYDVNLVSAIAVIPFSDRVAVGLGFRMLSIDGIPRFSEVGIQDGTIDAGSYSIPFFIGYQISSHVSIGIKANYFSQILDNYSANTFGFSGGVQVRNLGIEGLHFLASVLNAGGKLTFYREKESMPFGMMGTIMYTSNQYPIGFVAHLLKFRNEKIRALIGTEYNYQGRFFVRAQYHISELQERGWSTGLGLRFGQTELSYDYIPSGVIQDRHAISFSVSLKPRKKYQSSLYQRKSGEEILELPPPRNLTYQYKKGKLVINWDYPLWDYPGVKFEVFVALNPKGPWHKLPYKNLQSRSVEFNPQAKSMVLYFKLKATYENKISPDSKILKVRINYQ